MLITSSEPWLVILYSFYSLLYHAFSLTIYIHYNTSQYEITSNHEASLYHSLALAMGSQQGNRWETLPNRHDHLGWG